MEDSSLGQVEAVEEDLSCSDCEEEVGEGAQEVDRMVGKVRKDPGQPTAAEIARHYATHLPYRSWCKHCVNGRGVTHPHLTRKHNREEEIPTVGVGYHYMGNEEEEGTVPFLCIKDADSKVIVDMVVMGKGVNTYVVNRVIQCLDLLGHKRLILKSDQEPAIVALCIEVKHKWGGDIIPERSIGRHSSCNGMIESGIRTMDGQIRTMLHSLIEHYGDIGSNHVCIAWLVEYASFLISMFGVGRDGKEPYKLLGRRIVGWSGIRIW